MSFRRILIAVDDSPLAAHAAYVGIELAQSLGSEVAFIHAIDPMVGYAPDSGIPLMDLIEVAKEDGKKLLGEFCKHAALQPPPLEFLQVGKHGNEIVKAANDWPADVIVIGSHGRGGLSRVLLGSVAEEVMRHASCPVLVVRGPA